MGPFPLCDLICTPAPLCNPHPLPPSAPPLCSLVSCKAVTCVAHTLVACRLASRFGDYRKDDPTSFNLQPQLEYLPQFMFNLRRSQFVQVGHSMPSWQAFLYIIMTYN